MAFTRLFTALLGSLYEPLTDAHLREDLKVIEWTMSKSASPEDSSAPIYVIRIRVPNPGLSVLSPGQPRYVAFIEGLPGGTLAASKVLARGVIKPLQGDLGQQTVYLDVACAPVDIQGKLLAYSLTLIDDQLYYDPLFESISFQRPQDALQARSASFSIDPVTHAISIEDWVDGDASPVINLDVRYDWASLKVEALEKPPCPKVRFVVSAEWQQQAWGICDVASRIATACLIGNVQPWISTLNPGFVQTGDKQLPGSLVRLGLGSGWTHEQGQDNCFTWTSESGEFPSGQTVAATFGQYISVPYNNPTTGESGYTHIPLPPMTQDYQEFISMAVYNCQPLNVPIRYEYDQSRIETATITVSMPLDDADLAGIVAEEELPEIKLNDLTAAYVPNPNPIPAPDQWGNYVIPYVPLIQVQPWDYQTSYKKGDVVEFESSWFRANKDTVGPFFKSSKPVGTSIRYSVFGALTYTINTGYSAYEHPDWDTYFPNCAMPDRRQPSFFDSNRGLQALQHAIMRGRAYLRKRLLSVQVSFTARWEEARDLTTGSRVRIRILSGSVRQPVVGKVVSLAKKWSASGRIVEVVMLCPTGTGAAAFPTPNSPVHYASGYFQESYVIDYSQLDPVTGEYKHIPSNGDASQQLVYDKVHGVYTLNGKPIPFNQLANYGVFNDYTGQLTAPQVTGKYSSSALTQMVYHGDYGFADVAWGWSAAAAYVPVDATKLQDPAYGCLQVVISNQARQQLNLAASYGWYGRNPAEAARDNPTSMSVMMRPIASSGPIERIYDVAATVTISPRGINLSTPGAEP